MLTTDFYIDYLIIYILSNVYKIFLNTLDAVNGSFLTFISISIYFNIVISYFHLNLTPIFSLICFYVNLGLEL